MNSFSWIRFGGFAQRLTAAAVLGFCLVASRLPAPVPPTPDPGDYIYLQLSAYDLDGRAGLVRIYEEGVEGVWTKVYLGGSTTPAYSWNRMGNFYRSSELLSQAGTLFRFTVEHPRLGIFEGTAKVGEQGPLFIIPTNKDQLGVLLGIWSHSLSPDSSGNNCGISINTQISDNYTSSCGYSKSINSLFDVIRPAWVTVKYLEGCNLHYLDVQRAYYPDIRVITYGDIVISWNNLTNSGRPYLQKLGEIPPVGPVEISINVDGYTTDTTSYISSNLAGYTWSALLHPLPDRPDAPRPTGYSFRQIDGLSTPTLTPTISATPAPTETSITTPTQTIAPTSIFSPSPSPNATASPLPVQPGVFWLMR